MVNKRVKNCLWCGASKLFKIAERKDSVGIKKCDNCKLVMVDQIPNNIDEFYYVEEYFNAGESNIDTGYAETYELMAPAFLFWQSALIDLISGGKELNFLEIGCATGNLLDIIAVNQPKLKIHGMDVSEYAVNAARQKGHEAIAAHIENYKYNPKMDIIFSSETMEHLDNLRVFLEGVKNNLKSDGSFLFYVPSINEKDAINEGRDYIRFTRNLEHLLHFTPEFFQIEMESFFNRKVIIQEFDTGFGPFIVGLVSNNQQACKKLQQTFNSLVSENLPRPKDKHILKNLTVIALKFGKFDFAQKLMEELNKYTLGKQDTLILGGLAGYHKGELITSNKQFEEYLKTSPGGYFGIKSLLANERALNRIYLEEISSLKEKLADNNKLETRAYKAENELLELKQSKLVGTSIKARVLVGKTLNPIRNKKKK
jgi:SAM-dependent methyltransferase